MSCSLSVIRTRSHQLFDLFPHPGSELSVIWYTDHTTSKNSLCMCIHYFKPKRLKEHKDIGITDFIWLKCHQLSVIRTQSHQLFDLFPHPGSELTFLVWYTNDTISKVNLCNVHIISKQKGLKNTDIGTTNLIRLNVMLAVNDKDTISPTVWSFPSSWFWIGVPSRIYRRHYQKISMSLDWWGFGEKPTDGSSSLVTPRVSNQHD
jgi:hypothetical protein